MYWQLVILVIECYFLIASVGIQVRITVLILLPCIIDMAISLQNTSSHCVQINLFVSPEN